jgi:DNA-binding response OmpR family regulator
MSASKILIVDDEPHVRLTYRVALETEGYEIAEAANGMAAVGILKSVRFDLLLLDLRMPEMDGLEVLHTLRSFDLDLPTVIITAHGDVPHAVEAMKYGAIDFLQKPIKPAELRQIVTDILQRHHPSFRHVPTNDFESHLRAAKRLMNLRHFDGAREHLIKALEMNDQSPEALNLAGVLFEMQEDFTKAEQYYKQALRLNKLHPGAQANMRRIYELFHFGSSKEPYHLGNV